MLLQIPHDLVLEDEIVSLRALELADVENLLYFSENEPWIWKFSLVGGDGRENLEKYIRIAVNGREAGHSFPFIVYDKISGRYAGSTRFYDIQYDNRALQLGYTWYGEDFQGTGLNKRCKLMLLRYAFETLQMERVEFRADNENARSVAAMKSIGCRVEGVLRSNMPKPAGQQGRRDSIVLSILKQEWEGGVKELLTKKIGI